MSAEISKAAVPKCFRSHQWSVLKHVGQFRLCARELYFFIFYFLTHIAWNPWFWGPGGSEDSLQQDGSIHQGRRKFPLLPFTKCAVPRRGHASCRSSPKKRDPPGLGAKATTALAPEDRRRTPSLYSELSFWSQLYQVRTRISVCFFPFLTMKANMKTLISPLEPTSPEISVLWQTLDALVHLYGFQAVSEVSWLSRLRKPSHKGFFNPFY